MIQIGKWSKRRSGHFLVGAAGCGFLVQPTLGVTVVVGASRAPSWCFVHCSRLEQQGGPLSWAVLTELCPKWESSAYSVPLWCSPCPEQSGIAEGQEYDKLLQACPFSLRRRVWILLISASWPLRKGLFFIIFFMLWNWLWNSRLQWVGRYWQNSTLLRGVNLLLANYPQCLNSSLLLLIFKIFPKHVN